MVRQSLRKNGIELWNKAMGKEKGEVYFKVWSVLEGV